MHHFSPYTSYKNIVCNKLLLHIQITHLFKLLWKIIKFLLQSSLTHFPLGYLTTFQMKRLCLCSLLITKGNFVIMVHIIIPITRKYITSLLR